LGGRVPRPNQPRSIASSANVAEWITFKREQGGLSYDALAKAMTDVGCSITGTAIFRIEKGTPRRKIDVDELVAFAEVFDTDVKALLAPVEFARKEWARELVGKVFATYQALPKAVHTLGVLVAEIDKLAKSDPEIYEYFEHQWLTEANNLTARLLHPAVAAKLDDLARTVVAVQRQPVGDETVSI
jgi:hypothetical protein